MKWEKRRKIMFLRWDAIRVVVKYLRDIIHVEKRFRDAIRVQLQVLYK